jgi:hypothetical protein
MEPVELINTYLKDKLQFTKVGGGTRQPVGWL